MNALLNFWAKYRASPNSKFHPCDRARLQELNRQGDVDFVDARNLDEYIDSGHSHHDGSHLHVHLLPTPYLGNPKKADIFFILMNPGFSDDAYFALSNKQFQNRLRQNLNGNAGENYAFLYLDPRYCWTSGYQWWEQKLYRFGDVIAGNENLTHREGMQKLSQRICAIEMFPYASRALPWHGPNRENVLASIQSSLAAERAAKFAYKKALDGKALVVLKRNAASLLRIRQNKGRKVFVCAATQGFQIGRQSDSGKALKKWLGR